MTPTDDHSDSAVAAHAAFDYLNGKLTAAEEDAFLLSLDEPANADAFVDAVLIRDALEKTQALCEYESQRRKPVTSRVVRLVSTAAAAVGLLGVCLFTFSSPTDLSGQRVNGVPASDLVPVWVELQGDGGTLSAAETVFKGEPLRIEGRTEDREDAIVVPDWLSLAVAIEEEISPLGDPNAPSGYSEEVL